MNPGSEQRMHYKRSRFSTLLPREYLYTPSHAWLSRQASGVWRVGLTKFATRMLGEMVDHGFECQPGQTVSCGQVVGWVEGFKAISDLYCVASGIFRGANSHLQKAIGRISKDPYGEGWLYEVEGLPEDRALKVEAYASLLDKTIDRILEKQGAESTSPSHGHE